MKKILLSIITAVMVATPVVTIAPAASASTVQVSVQPTFSETMGQRQARLKAADYLRYQAFSRLGLIAQLKYEGFTYRQAVYGVDHITVSWYRQAVRKAKSYLAYQHFSRSGLIAQLRYEKFTYSQAVYGVNHTGL